MVAKTWYLLTLGVILLTASTIAQDANTQQSNSTASAEDDAAPTYEGQPRSNYTYTGTEEDLFERWQDGGISTETFQTATAQGDGTASLEINSSGASSVEGPSPVGSSDRRPTDPNDDGIFEDVNGDGSITEEDADLLSNNEDSIPEEDIQFFDPDGNGEIEIFMYTAIGSNVDGPKAVGDAENRPTDPDDDRIFEDLNGDGSITEEDADLLSNNEDNIPQEDIQFFDPNDNGEIDIFMYAAIGSNLDGPKPIGDAENRPTDPDGDGLFEDLNGDGEVTQKDRELLERQIDAAGEVSIPKASIQYFDADGDGEIGEQMLSEIDAMLDADPPPIGDSESNPTDPDGDGLFEDVNGDGRLDRDDPVLLFEQLSNLSPSYFDFNGNGRLDYDDIVELRSEISDLGDQPGEVGNSTNRPNDPDGDGLFEDVDGDGDLTASDPKLMNRHLGDLVPGFFDFDGNGTVSRSDVTSLRSEIARSNIDISLASDDASTRSPVDLSISLPEVLDVESVRLDWDDGETTLYNATSRLNASDSISVQHAYENQGDYAVDVTVELRTGLEVEVETELSVGEPDLPTYKGVPRQNYTYTGNRERLFEQWQSGEISTTAFQFRTEMGEGTASLVLETRNRDISVNLETSEPVADTPARFSVSSSDGEVEEAGWDFDNDDVVESYGSSVQYTYQEPGEYTVRADVETENGYTEELTLPVEVEENEEALRYKILSPVKLPDAVVDKDVLSPRVELKTNAQRVVFFVGDKQTELFDDGDHGDSASGDMLYSNTLSVSEMLGQKQVRLRFNKDNKTASRVLGEQEFLRTPPSPGLQLKKTDSGIVINTSRNGFSAPTNVSIEVYNLDSESTQPEETVELKCTASSNCETVIDNSFPDGSELQVKATQSYRQLTSQTATNTVTLTDGRRISSASVTQQYAFDQEVEFVRGQSWSASRARMKPVGFSPDDIESAYITVNGQRQQRLTRRDMAYGYVYYYDDISIPADQLGTEGTVNLAFEAELSDGTILSEEIAQKPLIVDSSPPEISIESQPLPNDPSSSVELLISGQEDLSNSVQFQVTSGGNTVWSGETNVRSTDRFAESKKISVSGAVPELSISVTDSSGNTATTSRNILVDPERVLEGVELNGNPRSKINLVVYGQGMSTSETREALNRNLEYYFGEQDLSVHDRFRDYFNWYIVDSEKELCGEFDPRSSSLRDDCPMVTGNPAPTFGQTDKIRGGRTAVILLSKEYFRSYMARDYTIIADQDPSSSGGIDKPVFAHELGHLIWGFDDEYGQDNTISTAFPTEFFKASDNSNDYDVRNYSNTFDTVQECEAEIRQVYSSLDPAVCTEQKNGAIVYGDEGRSLMYFNAPVYYPTHTKRISYLLENSPVMEAS